MNNGFSLFARENKTGKITYYARFKDKDGQIIRTVSTGASNYKKAVIIANELEKQGIIPNHLNPLANEYFEQYWRLGGDYAQIKQTQGNDFSAYHLIKSHRLIQKHMYDYLKGKRMQDLTPAIINKAAQSLNEKGVGPRTINGIIVAIQTAYKEYYTQNCFPNRLEGVRKVNYKPAKKGILRLDEIQKLLELQESMRIHTAVLLGTFCGLRIGECRGLQFDDIDINNNLIHVIHNVVDHEKIIKSPKHGSKRTVGIPDFVINAILACKKGAQGSNFVLFNENVQDKPMPYQSIRRGFTRCMGKIGISSLECKKRNLTFHSLRHTFVSMARTCGIPDNTIMSLSVNIPLQTCH